MNIYIYKLIENIPVAEEGSSQSIIVKVVKAKNRNRADKILREEGYGPYLGDTFSTGKSKMVIEVKGDKKEKVVY